MTGNDMPTHSGLPPGPPWPLDLLADLHAGVLDPLDADELRRRVESDPESRATLAAFDATQRALASLPRPRMPDDVVTRIDAAIAREAASAAGGPTDVDTGTALIVNLAAERARRRTLITGAGILAAAAAAAVVFAVANLTDGTTNGQPTAGMSPLATQSGTSRLDRDTESLTLSSTNLGEALDDALGASEYGPLADSSKLADCLRANGLDPGDAVPVGAKQVTLDGKPGVLMVLPVGSNPPKWRLLVVGPECGLNNPATLASTTIG